MADPPPPAKFEGEGSARAPPDANTEPLPVNLTKLEAGLTSAPTWGDQLRAYETQKRHVLDPGVLGGFDTIRVTGGMMKEQERVFDPLLQRYRDDRMEGKQRGLEEKARVAHLNRAKDIQMLREGHPFDVINNGCKLEALGGAAVKAVSQPTAVGKRKFPDTFQDFNILSNLPFSKHHWDKPERRPLPNEKLPKERLVPTFCLRDYNIVTNRYNEEHAKKSDKDAELVLLENTAKFRSRNRFNPITQAYVDPSEDLQMKKFSEAHEVEMVQRAQELVPPTLKNAPQTRYNILNPDEEHDPDFLKWTDLAEDERKERFKNRYIAEFNAHSRDVRQDHIENERLLNKVSLQRYQGALERGHDIVTNENTAAVSMERGDEGDEGPGVGGRNQNVDDKLTTAQQRLYGDDSETRKANASNMIVVKRGPRNAKAAYLPYPSLQPTPWQRSEMGTDNAYVVAEQQRLARKRSNGSVSQGQSQSSAMRATAPANLGLTQAGPGTPPGAHASEGSHSHAASAYGSEVVPDISDLQQQAASSSSIPIRKMSYAERQLQKSLQPQSHGSAAQMSGIAAHPQVKVSGRDADRHKVPDVSMIPQHPDANMVAFMREEAASGPNQATGNYRQPMAASSRGQNRPPELGTRPGGGGASARNSWKGDRGHSYKSNHQTVVKQLGIPRVQLGAGPTGQGSSGFGGGGGTLGHGTLGGLAAPVPAPAIQTPGSVYSQPVPA